VPVILQGLVYGQADCGASLGDAEAAVAEVGIGAAEGAGVDMVVSVGCDEVSGDGEHPATSAMATPTTPMRPGRLRWFIARPFHWDAMPDFAWTAGASTHAVHPRLRRTRSAICC
jgi:hypothetical protein